MNLKCKKSFYQMIIRNDGSSWEKARIHEGVYYKVIHRHSKPSGERYWCFEIISDDNNSESGWFIIDEYFETPEEVRDNLIDELLQSKEK